VSRDDVDRWAAEKLKGVPQPLPHEETTQSFAGKKGERLTVAHRSFYLFKIDEIRPTDTLSGYATEIEGIFVGADTLFYTPFWTPPTGVLSVNFWPWWKRQGKQPTADALIDISICLKFLEDAEWSARLIGRAFGKEEGDTRAIARERAVRKHEASILRDHPAAADNPQFQEMIKRMLEVP